MSLPPPTHDPMACRIVYRQLMAWYEIHRATAAPRPRPVPCRYGCNS